MVGLLDSTAATAAALLACAISRAVGPLFVGTRASAGRRAGTGMLATWRTADAGGGNGRSFWIFGRLALMSIEAVTWGAGSGARSANGKRSAKFNAAGSGV